MSPTPRPATQPPAAGRTTDEQIITTTDPADAQALSRVAAEAFHDLPAARWLVGDHTDRAAVLPPFHLPSDGPAIFPMLRPLWSFLRPTPAASG